MAKSAPEISFSVDSIDYGTIDVGGSSARQTYFVYSSGSIQGDSSYARAINMSISFKESYNASEARNERWTFVSTAEESCYIGSIGASECYVNSIISGRPSSAEGDVNTWVSIPAGAGTAGHVGFYLHHRLRAVIRRVGEGTSILGRIQSVVRLIGGFSAQLFQVPLPF